MLSPWIDLRINSATIINNAAVDPVLTKNSLRKYTELYLGGKSLSEANPIENMFGDFPPTLILVGEREILLDDSKLVFSLISKNQPMTRLTVYENATHVWLLDDLQTLPSRNAIDEMKTFIVD
jgi:acetyl esterase/lipase